ncbi:unnamed protein product [Dovyalis caffra]|uniref:Uncharacterized protein n=1 Tax=Dovyalis caffra TaxID=77055 RepID=A0AAV1S1C3_9ROSI|nr:unnamed protein product [Dovyalis caffra]
MEEGNKKKRNKKKKNKQNNNNNNKATEDDVSVGVNNSNNSSNNNNNTDNTNGQNYGDDNQVIEVASNGDAAVAEDFSRHNDMLIGAASNSSIVAEAEKQKWLQREATFEETIKRLQEENDSHIQKEASFEKTIQRLRDENDSHIQKEATLVETGKQLQNENDSHTLREASLEDEINQLRSVNNLCMQKEATFEDTIKQLKTENDSLMQKEAGLEMKIVQLQSEKHFWLEKEAGLEEKLNCLQDENAALGLKAASLEEKIRQLESEKDSWTIIELISELSSHVPVGYWLFHAVSYVFKAVGFLNNDVVQGEGFREERRGERGKGREVEQMKWEKTKRIVLEEKLNTTKETVTGMNIDITRLRMQVVELEDSRNSLVKENQQLKESVSDLKLQLQNIETSVSSANTSELGKHGAEKEELNSQIEAACALVDKLITENADLVEKVNELYIKLDQQRAAASLSSVIGSDAIVTNSELANGTHPVSDSTQNLSALDHKLVSLEVEPAVVVPNSPEADTGEIVQIPLDDNEVQDLEMQAVETDDKSGVPITDAPLIGAPFRLISFVAKYVSGADLVNKDDSN